MPRYFFHTRDGVPVLDDTGAEFADDAAARTEALRALGEFLRYGEPDVWRSGALTLVVQDQAGRLVVVLSATVSTAFPADWPWVRTPPAC